MTKKQWKEKSIQADIEDKGLPIEYREIRRLEKENKELRNRLENWIYELAYYTEDEVATPKGVKKFVGKALEDKVKEIKELLKLKEALLKGSVKALKERDTVKYKLEELQKEVKELRELNQQLRKPPSRAEGEEMAAKKGSCRTGAKPRVGKAGDAKPARGRRRK